VSQKAKLSIPQRRRELLHRRVGDRVVVLDTATNRAMALEASMGVVWLACDGTASPEVVAGQTGLTLEQVEGSLGALSTAGLLEPLESSQRSVISRRAVLGAGAGVSAALVTTVLLPTPAMASSGVGETTTTNGPVPGVSAASGAQTAGSVNPGPTTARLPSTDRPAANSSHSGVLAFTGLDAQDEIGVAVGMLAAGTAIVAANKRGRAKRSLSQREAQE